jgi:hypothetical protein
LLILDALFNDAAFWLVLYLSVVGLLLWFYSGQMKLKRRYIYIPLLAGASTPWLVLLALESLCTPRMPMFKYLGFFDMAIATIPFAVLILAMKSIRLKGVRLECVFWGGFVVLWGMNLFIYWQYWYPFYDPARPHISSTHAIALLFIPGYLLLFLAAGLFVGWVVSLLPVFKGDHSGKVPEI